MDHFSFLGGGGRVHDFEYEQGLVYDFTKRGLCYANSQNTGLDLANHQLCELAPLLRSNRFEVSKVELKFTISNTNNDPYTISPTRVCLFVRSNSQTTRRCQPPTLRPRSLTELELITCLQKEELDCMTMLDY